MRSKALYALLLTVPAPSLGVLAAMVWWPDTAIGASLFIASKLWLFSVPVLWHLLVDRQRLSWSPPKNGGFTWGAASGLMISAIITLAYFALASRLIDFSFMRAKMSEIGLDDPGRYAFAAAYWILVNSVLEEYVWRWFVYRKCSDLIGKWPGIMAAGLFFTLHHFVALRVYMDFLPALLCSTGVLTGGIVWSYMYARFRSIWPGYLSHAIVDLCIFSIGAGIIFIA